jgi:transcriptional regulator with XRE-family HTH domain
MDKIEHILSLNLKRLRKERGITQETLAERMGVAWTTVQAYEGRRRWPERDNVAALAKALGVREAELFRDPASVYEPTPKQALAVFKKLVDGLK